MADRDGMLWFRIGFKPGGTPQRRKALSALSVGGIDKGRRVLTVLKEDSSTVTSFTIVPTRLK